MTKWKKWLSTLLIIAGIGIMAFPIGNKLYINYWNQRLLAAYDNELMLNEEAPPMAESDFLALQAIYENNDALNETSNEAETTEVANGENTTESTTVVETTEAATEKPKRWIKVSLEKLKFLRLI